METKKVWANLPAEDVERTRDFYTSLGFRVNGDGGDRGVLASFLVGETDFVVHFFSEDRFEASTDGTVADARRTDEVMFTLSADSRQEVRDWAEAVEAAGGTVFSEPAAMGETWFGCGFADPDGHKWNVFHNAA